MRLLISSALLGLAWFGAANLLSSAAAWLAAARAVSSDRLASRHLLSLRLAPAVVSLVFAVAIFLPAHWRFEPAQSDESFGLIVLALAALGAFLLARTLWRMALVTRDTRLLKTWSQRLPADPETGAYTCEGFSGVSLAGFFRGRIFVGAAVRRVLSQAELRAAVAHERAHQRSLDNLKRAAMFCAPDLFGATRLARRLEQQWRAEAECRADAEAAAGDRGRAVDLASALLKVTRLSVDAPAPLRCPIWSAFHEPPLLETRVRRLLDSRGEPGSSPPPRPAFRLLPWAPLFAAAGVWLLGAGADLHHLTEALVRVLP